MCSIKKSPMNSIRSLPWSTITAGPWPEHSSFQPMIVIKMQSCIARDQGCFGSHHTPAVTAHALLSTGSSESSPRSLTPSFSSSPAQRRPGSRANPPCPPGTTSLFSSPFWSSGGPRLWQPAQPVVIFTPSLRASSASWLFHHLQIFSEYLHRLWPTDRTHTYKTKRNNERVRNRFRNIFKMNEKEYWK